MSLTLNLAEIDQLAPMPPTIGQLACLMTEEEDVSLMEIVKVVEFDQALTANVLRLANSALGASVSGIHTIKDALVRLGTAQLLKLAVSGQIAGPLALPCPAYDLAEHELWCHSVAAALAAEHLCAFMDNVPKYAFTASLMHDIGKLLINRNISREEVHEINTRADRDRITHLQAERRALGTDHAEVGGAIARYWNFPEALAGSIEYHHNPDIQADVGMDIVHLSNTVTKIIGVGLGSEQMNMTVSLEMPQRLGISASDLESLCVKVKSHLMAAEMSLMK
ncbi:MAG: HDOD domain-containing protein [Planctomycetota bacterium]